MAHSTSPREQNSLNITLQLQRCLVSLLCLGCRSAKHKIGDGAGPNGGSVSVIFSNGPRFIPVVHAEGFSVVLGGTARPDMSSAISTEPIDKDSASYDGVYESTLLQLEQSLRGTQVIQLPLLKRESASLVEVLQI